MSAVIRPAGVADAPWLAALAERTFRETYTAHNTPENMEQYVAAHSARRSRRRSSPTRATSR